ncbi:UNKNOWN [Stylonychia lemnae]|uniref:Uncharacterized protein n=1 Tax=Stylonychia lemnae TaxID=5949 RepID=A0A078AXS9_STYLE|nr:UNKNOWN [Stylonychia lemnae]|eukprot:CDW85603.1 UNKNOWN [Stylonychia lemnae]
MSMNLTRDNIDFALNIMYGGNNHDLVDRMDEFFTLEVLMTNFSMNKDLSGQYYQAVILPMVKCSENRFSQDQTSDLSRKLLSKFDCLYENFSIPMMGSLTKYFDEKDFLGDPIKDSIKFYRYQFNTNVMQKQTIKLHQNFAYLKDSLISTRLDNKNISYYDVFFEQYSTGMYMPDFFINLQMVIDDKILLIERTQLNIIDALSKTGGQIGLLYPIIRLFLYYIQEAQYISSIMKRIFYFEEQKEDLRFQTINRSKTKAKISLNETNKTLTKDENKQSIDYIKSLRPFEFRLKDNFLLICRKQFCCKKYRKLTQRQRLFKDGLQKLQKELEITRVLRALKTTDLLAKIIIS